MADILFVTWFTYDATGKAWWLTMTAPKTAHTGRSRRSTSPPAARNVSVGEAADLGDAVVVDAAGRPGDRHGGDHGAVDGPHDTR